MSEITNDLRVDAKLLDFGLEAMEKLRLKAPNAA